MAKRFLKKYMIDEQALQNNPWLSRCLSFTRRAKVWHFTRRSAARAVLIGTFCAFIPLPIQMFLALALCIWARANLPLTMGIVWLTNPLTIAPVFLATYHFGAFLLGQPTISFEFEMSWGWIQEQLLLTWQPLLLGSLVCGAFFGGLGYVFVKISWRKHIQKRWDERRARMQARIKKFEDEHRH